MAAQDHAQSADAATLAPLCAAQAELPDVIVIAEGIFYLTACAIDTLDGPGVERAIRRERVAGTSNGWRLCEDEHFSGGQTNPCVCDRIATRKHWLLDC